MSLFLFFPMACTSRKDFPYKMKGICHYGTSYFTILSVGPIYPRYSQIVYNIKVFESAYFFLKKKRGKYLHLFEYANLKKIRFRMIIDCQVSQSYLFLDLSFLKLKYVLC